MPIGRDGAEGVRSAHPADSVAAATRASAVTVNLHIKVCLPGELNEDCVLPSHQPGGMLGRADDRAVVLCRSERKARFKSDMPSTPSPAVPIAMDEMPHADALDALRSGRRESLDTLTALLYQELREIAHRHRASER